MTEKSYRIVPTRSLFPYKNNSKKHPARQIEQIADSIRKFGFLAPILVDGEMSIIAGHGRWQAAMDLGLEGVPVIEINHLTEDEKRAYIIADNKLAESSGWHDDMLRSELKDLYDLGLAEITGFSFSEIDDILGFDPSDDLASLQDTTDITDERELPAFSLRVNEHNDYLVFIFSDELDFVSACTAFDVHNENGSLFPAMKKIGIGRVIQGTKLLAKVKQCDCSND